ncbi:MAG TPA: mechanosensitive ion channel family protein [Steroidobacteraceae bacterium]|nr:mechanosensitive ion channel family protein [Steroidobacteraceae bacterium]HRX90399.1 mechanosensitive ion channel family protein [Steroidobacteraceae bacterium]
MLLASGLAAAQSSSNSVVPDNANPEARAQSISKAPVRFRDRTLFEISSAIGALEPQNRAAAIEQRLLTISAGSADVLADLRVVERDGLSEIFAGETLIRAVTDQDAANTGRTRRQLAADYQVQVYEALAIEFRDRSVANVLRSLLYTLAATLVLAALLVGLRRLYRWSRDRVNRAAQAWSWESGLARMRILTPAAVSSGSRSIAATLAWLIGIALLYFYLEYVLSLFPWTRGIAERMVTTSRAAVLQVGSGLIGYLPNLLNMIVIIFVARFILRAVRAVFDQIRFQRLTLQGFYPEWAMPTYSLIRFLVIAIAAVMVFPYLPGSGSEGFRGVSVFVGLLVSLGAASAIANVIAGIVITYMRPFKVGDRVKIADAVGDVTGKDLFVVRLRTIKNVDITIPNSLVLANHIINYSSSADTHGLVLHSTVTIGYDVPWQKVHELLISAASRVEGILADPAPFVLQTSLDDFYVSYELNAYTKKPAQMALIYSALHTNIQNAFNDAGVEIMSPHYTAVRDGNRMAVPDEHLPKDYRTPNFGIFSRILRTDRPA